MKLFSLIYTTPACEAQLMSFESIAKRNQVFDDLVDYYTRQGSVQTSQHDNTWILNTKKGEVRIYFRDHQTI